MGPIHQSKNSRPNPPSTKSAPRPTTMHGTLSTSTSDSKRRAAENRSLQGLQARASQPALTTPKRGVINKSCAVWRLKSGAPADPEGGLNHERDHPRGRKNRIPLVRDSYLGPTPQGILSRLGEPAPER